MISTDRIRDDRTEAEAASLRKDFLGGETVSVVIPALNEDENLKHVLPRIPSWVHEVILVDDHCTEDNVAVAVALLPPIKIVRNLRPPRKGNALRSGFEPLTGSIVVQIDPDGSEAPEGIPALVGAILSGADCAKGTRFVPRVGTTDMPRLRATGDSLFVQSARVLFGAKFTDFCHGYNAFRTSALDVLQLDADGFEIEAVLNIRTHTRGLRIREVPSFEAERVHGVGRLNAFPDGWHVLKAMASERAGNRRGSQLARRA